MNFMMSHFALTTRHHDQEYQVNHDVELRLQSKLAHTRGWFSNAYFFPVVYFVVLNLQIFLLFVAFSPCMLVRY